jgi:molecular chaperone DnaK (HSP70)
MAEVTRPALGLSIGSTNLVAVTTDHAITRKPVLTLFRQRPPEVGVPSENPRLDEPGVVVTEFVDRVGDPVGIVASDGSVHRSEALVADALRALAYTATGGRALPEGVAVTYPARWGPAAVEALGTALSRVSEWSNRARPLTLIPDAAATLIAVRANPGIPARGIVAVCDFGGSGTSITLVDAAAEYQPVAPTVWHEFSGDLIDRALLASVMADLPSAGSSDPFGTSAIGSLARLRTGCRIAKEQLSSSTVTTLSDEFPGSHADIRLTRSELDDAIRDPLDNFLAVLEEVLVRNGIRGSDLAAVVSVGGGANIPAVTTTLSGRLRVPVVTTPRPQLTAAIGGALRAVRGPGDTSATVLTPAAPAAVGSALLGAEVSRASGGAVTSGPTSVMMPALTWAETHDDSRVMPAGSGAYPRSSGGSGHTGYTAARPSLNFEHEELPRSEPEPKILPWYRLPAVVMIGTAVALLLVGMAVAMGLSSDNNPAPAPGVNSTPAPASAPPANGGSPQSAPANPPPQQAPSAQPPAAPPPAAPAADAPDVPAPQAPAPAAPPPVQVPPVVPRIPPIPAIPRIPGIGAPIPGIPVPHR